MTSEERRTQCGKGYNWTMTTGGRGGNVVETSGLTIDNLDKKSIEEATCKFEKIFIHIRNTLESYDGDFSNKYDVCHHIARCLTKNFDDI